MHSPRPYGLLVVNGKLTENDSLFIDHQLKKLSNQKAISNLDSIRQVKDLPDGGYVILQDMGGMLKAIAHKELSLDEFESDGLAKVYVPMLYSGVITKARIRKEEGLGLKLTEQSRRRLINYSNETLPNKELNLQRFIIEPNAQIVPEFIPQNSFSDFITTQYVQQRPTWYSGAMAEVMQIVGGYGRQDFNNLPDLPFEKSRIQIPEKYMERIVQEIEGIRLPAYSGIPPLDGAFQYDYKFHSTNGIVFDTANKPWLIRIRSNGVFAMPMPIVPVTATRAFREYVEEVGDEEILNILNRFSAMPSGETFPIGKDFEAWRRAGAIIKVCDTADFYSHIYYSPACGWSLNLKGSEGFNTAYTYNNEGIAVGVAYKLRCEFSPAENQGWLKAVKITGEKAKFISNYLSKLYEILPKGDQKTLAILYKLRRVNTEDIFQRALTSLHDPLGVTGNDVRYWDNLELEPIASLHGNISQVAKGFLYHNAKPKFQPQIKFPMVEIGGCISFDFGASAVPKQKPNCDTIMYGYYVGNSLKVIKYFVDWRGYQKQIESNYEPMMTVGSWEQTESSGSSSPQGYFYTTDFDFREVFTPVVTTTTIKGEDKGFDSKPFFSFDAPFWRPGTLWRNRYYTHLTKSNRTESEAINIAICIPYLTRNTALLAKKNSIIAKSNSESLSLYSMRDPTSYRYWTYDSIFAWAGGLEKMTGKPYPVNGSPVWVEIENYNPSEYSDFADQGSWLPGLPYDITWLVHPDTNQWNHNGGGGAPKVKGYAISSTEPSNTTGSLYVDISEIPVQVHSQIPQDWYFYMSPDEYRNVFYRDACKVVFGDSEYANISETNENNLRYKWGYSSLVEHKSAYHFIGVINE
ncbi:hypothetical protein [Acinetobacter sp. CFCC 11171]|uniref:hypothetical protein n=1 Tax=Acinetobacter sp. CFCC 11171 TaxID=1775558 RepID=UPI000DD02B6A|nr:hypothetical protein [Acinetobacter sp. CFCC 11171]